MDPILMLEACQRVAEGKTRFEAIPPRIDREELAAAWSREPRRVRQLLDAVLCAPDPGAGLEALLQMNVFHVLIPELVLIRGLGDDPEAALHKDVWDHTKRVVAGVPATLELRWGALMHDIGKAQTRQVVNGKVTFHNHDFVGARMLDKLDQRSRLFLNDQALFKTVRMLVLNHLRPAQYKKDWGDSGVRRLITDLNGLDNFQLLMSLSRADLTTKNATKRERALGRGRELERRVKEVFEEDNAPRLPKGTMGLVLERSGRKPGPWLNKLRETLEALMKAGVLPVSETVDFYVEKGLELSQVSVGPC